MAQSNILGTNLNLSGGVRHGISFQVQQERSLSVFGYVDLHIRISVVSPRQVPEHSSRSERSPLPGECTLVR